MSQPMQVPNAIIFVAAEIIIVLLICTVVFFVHSRKLKSLVRRQQEKLLALLEAQVKPIEAPQASPITSTRNYKSYLNDELDVTASQFSVYSPDQNIALELPEDSPLLQRILALRYAFLRAEELGTTEERGSNEYWSIFQQTLEPLLAPPQRELNSELESELETAKKRIENLEKFKRLFFDMEKQWAEAQTNAQDYYAQLLSLSEGVDDRALFNNVLEKYHGVYDNIQQNITQVIQNPDAFNQQKVINIIRQDPRAADEIVKLRNVAADQHRIINDLQKKLMSAVSAEEKEVVIHELQQQLQRQIRFVNESETCIQLLEDELAKAHEEISIQEKSLNEANALSEENQQIKNVLHSFTQESKDLINSINQLEDENNTLKQTMRHPPTTITSQVGMPESTSDVKKIQSELNDLKKQYAELEERYLDLKLG
jgi:DNA repair exonuclease SbcCD ATPase subunit